MPGPSAVARFVGVEAYEAAGGKVPRDLFARDDESSVWFEDPVLLEKRKRYERGTGLSA